MRIQSPSYHENISQLINQTRKQNPFFSCGAQVIYRELPAIVTGTQGMLYQGTHTYTIEIRKAGCPATSIEGITFKELTRRWN